MFDLHVPSSQQKMTRTIQNNKNILMFLQYLVVLAFSSMIVEPYFTTCAVKYVCLLCVLMCLYNKNIKNSEQFSMCGCAMFGCGGMCFDALSNMSRTLCSLRPVFALGFVVFVLVTAILIQRLQVSMDDRVICHPGQAQHVCIAAMFLFRLSRWMDWPSFCHNGNMYPCNVPL